MTCLLQNNIIYFIIESIPLFNKRKPITKDKINSIKLITIIISHFLQYFLEKDKEIKKHKIFNSVNPKQAIINILINVSSVE